MSQVSWNHAIRNHAMNGTANQPSAKKYRFAALGFALS